MKPISEAELEQLSAYIDGELSDSERRFFQQRLAHNPELQAACERAWITSSVLKSQSLQLMPVDSAEAICARCQPNARMFKTPWRLLVSFAALALMAGLAYQLLSDTQPLISSRPVIVQRIPAASTQRTATTSDSQMAVVDDPAHFALNETTRSRSWPKRDQVMDDYLVRHNQMTGSNTGNDLISYARLLSAPEVVANDAGRDGP